MTMAANGKFTAKNAAEEFITKIGETEPSTSPLANNSINPQNIQQPAQKRKTRPMMKGSGFVQRAYYISDEVYKKLKMLAVEEDRDASSIVREALDEYLKRK